MAKIAINLYDMAGYLSESNWSNGPEFEMRFLFSRYRCHPLRIVPLDDRGTVARVL
jgi:hypothetical protein